ncbi:MAG: class II aldolase/adducin family protein, partial [Leptospiraceae bacterium]|nr:class II aldolase/adducin family protein [Leptospiraceae bacterium]
MKSLWNDDDAKNFKGDLGLRVYTTRLLGADDTLVLHGGGNTSVKIKEKNLFSEEEEILYVKGSGWDLASIEEAGFSPVSLQHLIRLAGLSELSDPEMVNEMKTHMTRASAPSPSVEAILHAILPFKYVDHTHADAVVSITNTENGKEKIQDIYGDSVVIIPYIMPGFDLARLCNELYRKESKSSTIGMILLNHGVFSFGDTAKESYERMIHLVSLAESYLQSKNAYYLSSSNNYEKKFIGLELASLRKKVSETAGSAMILYSDRSDRCLNFTNRPDLQKIATQGPATPDHVIRTKRIPLIGRDVDSFVKNYKTYFETNEP